MEGVLESCAQICKFVAGKNRWRNLCLLPHQFGHSLKEWIDLFEQCGCAKVPAIRVEKDVCQNKRFELEICKSLYGGLARGGALCFPQRNSLGVGHEPSAPFRLRGQNVWHVARQQLRQGLRDNVFMRIRLAHRGAVRRGLSSKTKSDRPTASDGLAPRHRNKSMRHLRLRHWSLSLRMQSPPIFGAIPWV